MDILTNFGVKPVLLIAQVVNFLLLLFILKRFLYKPILKVLDERKQKIVQSLKNADEIKAKLEQITLEREEKLKKASKEAEEILQIASVNADKIITQAHEKAYKDIEKLIEKSKQEMDFEKEKLHQEVREEVADLLGLALQKVTGKVLSDKEQQELVKKSIKGMI